MRTVILLASTIFIPLIAGSFYYKSLTRPMRIILYLLAVGTLSDGIMLAMALNGVRNLYIVHVYTLIELLLIAWFYVEVITHQVVKRAIFILVPALILFAIGYAFVGRNISDFNSAPRVLESILIIGMAAWVFFEIATDEPVRNPISAGEFYINGALMFRFAASFIIFAFSNYMLQEDMAALRQMIGAKAWTNAISNVMLGIGMVAPRAFVSLKWT